MNIPIRNIYYIVLYAFDQVKNKLNKSDKDLDEINNFNDVITMLFVEEVSGLVKKGLFRKYKDK